MGQIRHDLARLHSSDTAITSLSWKFGINVKTVAKSRKREMFEDRKTGSTVFSSTALRSDDEAMAVA